MRAAEYNLVAELELLRNMAARLSTWHMTNLEHQLAIVRSTGHGIGSFQWRRV